MLWSDIQQFYGCSYVYISWVKYATHEPHVAESATRTNCKMSVERFTSIGFPVGSLYLFPSHLTLSTKFPLLLFLVLLQFFHFCDLPFHFLFPPILHQLLLPWFLFLPTYNSSDDFPKSPWLTCEEFISYIEHRRIADALTYNRVFVMYLLLFREDELENVYLRV